MGDAIFFIQLLYQTQKLTLTLSSTTQFILIPQSTFETHQQTQSSPSITKKNRKTQAKKTFSKLKFDFKTRFQNLKIVFFCFSFFGETHQQTQSSSPKTKNNNTCLNKR